MITEDDDFITITCDTCKDWQRVTNDDYGRRKLVVLGWVLDKNKHLCRACKLNKLKLKS